MSHESNGHLTAEAFCDRANRLRTVASLDNWWREYDSKLPADVPPKTREKAQRVYIQRKSELESTTKNGAKRVLNQDDHIGRTCLIGIWISAILSTAPAPARPSRRLPVSPPWSTGWWSRS
jgi:hypothetical protein